jgi:hypothetical protein
MFGGHPARAGLLIVHVGAGTLAHPWPEVGRSFGTTTPFVTMERPYLYLQPRIAVQEAELIAWIQPRSGGRIKPIAQPVGRK